MREYFKNRHTKLKFYHVHTYVKKRICIDIHVCKIFCKIVNFNIIEFLRDMKREIHTHICIKREEILIHTLTNSLFNEILLLHWDIYEPCMKILFLCLVFFKFTRNVSAGSCVHSNNIPLYWSQRSMWRNLHVNIFVKFI